MSFRSRVDPPTDLLERIAAHAPENPFFTPAYSRALAELGRTPIAFWLEGAADATAVGCIATMSRGRLGHEMEITSVPDMEDSGPFWSGLVAFARAHGVVDLVIPNYGSTNADIPGIAKERWRRPRREHRVALGGDDLLSRLSSNHRRNVRKALRAGLEVRTGADRALCEAHVELVNRSRARRRSRGESTGGLESFEAVWPFAWSGSGVFYQAMEGDRPLSSILVLLAEKGGYYRSAGSSPEGMKVGASHFLVYRLLEAFEERQWPSFNLAGADRGETGLTRFKTGFDTRAVDLEEVAFVACGVVRRIAIDALRGVRARLKGTR